MIRKKKKQTNRVLKPLFIYPIFLFSILLAVVMFYGYFGTEIERLVDKIKQTFVAADSLSGYPGKFEQLEIPVWFTDKPEQIIKHAGYTVSYNKKWLIPNWVAYELTRDEVKGREKRTNKFVIDPYVNGISATNADYTRSGYDRGHMAPAGDMTWDHVAMKESFFFSNICPQHPQLNRGSWKELEEHIREWVLADSAIVVVCGPIVSSNDPVIGKNRIKVPGSFFKVILSPYVKAPKGIGFLFKNRAEKGELYQYAVSIDSIESLTGMNFFSELPDKLENKLESSVDIDCWELGN